MVKVTSLLIEVESALGFSFGVRVQTEMKTWYSTLTLYTKGVINLHVLYTMTISELYLVISRKSQRRYPQNAVGKRSL